MQNSVEPPILLSRTLTFVFATMLVIVLVLAFSLYQMFPLVRPQVFFLMTQPRENLEIRLAEMTPSDENFEIYKRAFIREYIKARNEIVPNPKVMRMKWANTSDGIVRTWSNPDVYSAFQQTNMWRALMNDVPDFEFRCPVEFETGAIKPRSDNTYAVNFRYFCENSNGQVGQKDYTIRIRLEYEDGATVKWSERLNNPLGIRVAEYTVESGNGDPLDTGYLETGEQ